MKEYNLFLDESANVNRNKVLVAGFAIETKDEELLSQKMSEIKEIFWDKNYIDNNETVLHCTELSVINHNRSNKERHRFIRRPCYNIFKHMASNEIKNKMDKMYITLTTTVRNLNITIFGCIIDKGIYDYLYPEKLIQDDIYNIAIQCIVENYVHFLKSNDAVGNIVYESRNEGNTIKSDNVIMQKNFCNIIANNKGISFINSTELNKRIRNFIFPKKTEENAGLELADFICFYLLKSLFRDESQKDDFMKLLEKRLYNGNNDINIKDVRKFFGIRTLPENIQYINELEIELRKIRKALANTKANSKKIYEKNKILIEEKRKLEQELNKLKSVQKTV